MYVCMYVCMYACVCTYVYMCLHTCVLTGLFEFLSALELKLSKLACECADLSADVFLETNVVAVISVLEEASDVRES
jgi:hypothetical protein